MFTRASGVRNTFVRRKQALAWLWSTALHEPTWRAPAWGVHGASESDRESYRSRFLKDTLLHVGGALTKARERMCGV